MKLRILRTFMFAYDPSTGPLICGPGSKNQYYKKPIDKLQYWHESQRPDGGEWRDVPIVVDDKSKEAE